MTRSNVTEEASCNQFSHYLIPDKFRAALISIIQIFPIVSLASAAHISRNQGCIVCRKCGLKIAGHKVILILKCFYDPSNIFKISIHPWQKASRLRAESAPGILDYYDY